MSNSNNTSRRKFGKQIVGACASLPLISFAPSTIFGQRKRTDYRSHQDTPPPIFIEEGSIKVDVLNQNLPGGVLPPDQGGGYKWEFPKGPGNTHDIFLVGLKIVSGEDRLLFYLDRDFGVDRQGLTVRLHLEGPVANRQELVLTTDTKFVSIKVPSHRQLKQLTTPDPASPGRSRFRYHDDQGPIDVSIQSIAVCLGQSPQAVIARIDPGSLPEGPEGLRIMLWFEDIMTKRS